VAVERGRRNVKCGLKLNCGQSIHLLCVIGHLSRVRESGPSSLNE
jgi:hypothetical protein